MYSLFTTVITLKSFDGFVKLVFDVIGKVYKFGENVGFVFERIHPKRMRVVVEKNNIISQTTMTSNG